jgi:hypothetical protein
VSCGAKEFSTSIHLPEIRTVLRAAFDLPADWHLIDPSRAARQHIHAVERTQNGNDLLWQHYLQHPH